MRAMPFNCTDCECTVLGPINTNEYVRRFEGVGSLAAVDFRFVNRPNSHRTEW